MQAIEAEADRIVRVVAEAISYPRRDSADGLTRAAMATDAGRDGRLTVIAAEDVDAGDISEPFARLTFLVRLDGPPSSPDAGEQVTLCYETMFNHYGVVDELERVDCPVPEPEAVIPPTTTPVPTLPAATMARLRDALEALPPADRVDPAAVRAAVDALGLTETPVDVAAGGGAIGVAVRAGDDCVMARVAEVVDVWMPPRIYLQPGEGGCDAGVAATGGAVRPPH